MAVAFIQEFPIVGGDLSATNYDRVTQALNLTSSPDGLIVLFGPMRGNDLPRIVEFVTTHHLPTVFELGQGVRGGGLMEFGPKRTISPPGRPWLMAAKALSRSSDPDTPTECTLTPRVGAAISICWNPRVIDRELVFQRTATRASFGTASLSS